MQCEICSRELTGKQQRFCSTRCRNVSAGQIKKRRYQLPERDVLAQLYLLPPVGEGLSLNEIGKMYGVSDVTAGSWIKEHNLIQDAKTRLSHFAITHPKPRIPVPAKPELEALYRMPPEGEGLSQSQVAERYSVERQTARRWLQEYGLLELHSKRHSKRMNGAMNPAYQDGSSRHYHKNVLLRSGQEQVCKWCGATKQIQVHHINHDTTDGNPDNLAWLCGYCNRLEAQLWALIQTNRVSVTWEGKTLKIEFKE